MPAGAAAAGAPPSFLKNRYELHEMVTDRGGVARFRASDRGAGALAPVSVVVLRAPATAAAEAPMAAEEVVAEASEGDDMMPSFDEPATAAEVISNGEAVSDAAWPSIGWEKNLLDKAKHPALPRVLDHFIEDGYEYLVEEVPAGQPLGNCWDDFDFPADQKWGWLKQVAEALHAIHQSKAILEGIRPDLITIQANGQATINDLSDLLPLPLPPNPPIRGTLYAAPEVVAARSNTDARSDHYSFGGMLYGLMIGHDLNESDFDKKSGLPKNFIARLPDVHPLVGRIISKTFCRDPQIRFPTDEAGKKEPTGFAELIDCLATAQRIMPNVRMEIAAWTTTGIVRTGNEDAFNLMHAVESHLDDLSEFALIILADGMGGYEAGEVAAALCIQTLREKLTQQKFAQALRGGLHPAAVRLQARRGQEDHPRGDEGDQRDHPQGPAEGHRPPRHGLHLRGRLRGQPAHRRRSRRR